MTTDEIRTAFLEFFKSKGHKVVPSDSLVPREDPTLLFTGAGMNQFKEKFLGRNITYKRAASAQKCLRTGDLDKVGKTAGHHTFFEMLGNFSFGDYFKKEAIIWAWEFMTRTLGLPKDRLWASVYTDDREAYQIWLEVIRLPGERLLKLGAKENFWPSNAPTEGPDGPCGPCSEIFYDQGMDVGCRRSSCHPDCDCGRFIEVWNMVFTQFDRQSDGSLKPLPNKNIDTGMGLERIAAVMQGVRTNFEIDIFKPIIEEIKRHISRNQKPEDISQINAIADHIRAVAFAIGDGVMPSNEGRGYVIRRLIRRSVLYSMSLGTTRPYLYRLIPVVGRVMETPYPELKSRRELISQVVSREEENFLLVIENQGPRVMEEFARLSARKKEGASIEKELARAAFQFYDTYGIPYEVLEEYAQARGLRIPKELFDRLLDAQRELSRRKSKIKKEIFSKDLFEAAVKDLGLKTEFLGYNKVRLKARVLAILGLKGRIKEAKANQEVRVILDRTIFYGESGGQVGDIGTIRAKAVEVEVEDAKLIDDTIVHLGTVVRGVLKEGDRVSVEIDKGLREKTMANHTATHLLQNALRKVLGEHVHQSGSVVDPERLRFDFTHMKKLEARELKRIEDIVNSNIEKAHRVKIDIMAFDKAKKLGAIALFGEKYAEKVRVVSVGDSRELCGGTHVDNSSRIGIFKVVSESGVAAGVRRIEALTKEAARRYMKETIDGLIDRYSKKKDEIKAMGHKIEKGLELIDKPVEEVLKRPFPKKALETIAFFRKTQEVLGGAIVAIDELAKKVLREKERGALKEKAGELKKIIERATKIGNVTVVSAKIGDSDLRTLRSLADEARLKLKKSGVIVFGSPVGDKAYLVCTLTDDLVQKGLNASSIIKDVAKVVGGSGGGRPDFAQAGGAKLANLDMALKRVFEIAKRELSR